MPELCHYLSVASSFSGESDLPLRLCSLFTSAIVVVALWNVTFLMCIAV